jgi:surface antigen
MAVIIAGALVLSACQSARVGFKPTTMTKGLVSSNIGKGLSFADRKKALRVEFEALDHGRTGAPMRWTGWGGRRGSVIPGAAYRVNSQNCRDYSHTVYVREEAAVASGTACRTAKGGWKLAT